MDKVLEARGLKLREYLEISYGIMKIPYTQRPYEWGKPQISRLFYDFCNVYENKVDQHILNFITLFKEKDFVNIYDGQQRTVSTILIICAILNKLKQIPNFDQSFITKVKQKYIVDNDLFTSETKYKLSFEKQKTNEFFQSFVIEGNPNSLEQMTDEQKALETNYIEVSMMIDKTFLNRDLAHSLKGLLQAILEQVLVIVLETTNEQIANQMFETLNNTGKKIADFYVLKNQLVRALGEDDIKSEWDEIEKNLDGINKNKFLVAYASTFNGKTSEAGAYKAIEKNNKIADQKQANITLAELKKASKTYLYLDAPRMRYDIDEANSKRYQALVETLGMFSAHQYKTVVVAMELKGYRLETVNNVIQKLLNLHIRNIFISQAVANTLEQFYPALAQKIYLNDFTEEEVILEIEQKMTKGELLKNNFKNRQIITPNDKKALRYILREIYNYENKDEVKVFEDAQHVNLEHILPQTPNKSSEWHAIFAVEEEREKYTHSIGNMTVLLGTKNSSGGNQAFDVKKEIYKTSAIKHNHQIAELLIWNKQAIDSRVDNLYTAFLKIWS
ncbi:DUF262 domain-containing HNH endonuclease family protein [Solibacillus sp. FSL H8-0523]|uniref:DUF262 domain-containing protein n=1 Tax=Solibacillus sp. FSL H8-0523 TaxID=2954511 RepID=UPI0031015AD6